MGVSWSIWGAALVVTDAWALVEVWSQFLIRWLWEEEDVGQPSPADEDGATVEAAGAERLRQRDCKIGEENINITLQYYDLSQFKLS